MPAARAKRNAKDPDRERPSQRIAKKLGFSSKPQEKQAEKLSEASGGETNRMADRERPYQRIARKLGFSKPQEKQAEKLSEASGGETNRMDEKGGGVGEKA